MRIDQEKDFITVGSVVEWARVNRIDLGKNPRRTLVYLASNGIIPKTTRGQNCKGVYKKAEVFSRLSFYHSRRLEGWRVSDIAVALSRIQSAHEEAAKLSLPIAEVIDHDTAESLMTIPLIDMFKSVFKEYIKRNPDGAENLIQYLDEQESITGVKIGETFRKLVGVTSSEIASAAQTRIDF